LQALIIGRRSMCYEQLPLNRDAGSFATPRHERPRQDFDRVAAVGTEEPFGEKSAPLFGHGIHKLLKKRDVHTGSFGKCTPHMTLMIR
jgi:hypothetical protein